MCWECSLRNRALRLSPLSVAPIDLAESPANPNPPAAATLHSVFNLTNRQPPISGLNFTAAESRYRSVDSFHFPPKPPEPPPPTCPGLSAVSREVNRVSAMLMETRPGTRVEVCTRAVVAGVRLQSPHPSVLPLPLPPYRRRGDSMHNSFGAAAPSPPSSSPSFFPLTLLGSREAIPGAFLPLLSSRNPSMKRKVLIDVFGGFCRNFKACFLFFIFLTPAR